MDVPKRSETGLKPPETVGKQLYPLILHLWVTMDWARPRIINGGYRLRSLEVTPEGFWCDPWVHVMPVQWRSGRSVARTVDLATHLVKVYCSQP